MVHSRGKVTIRFPAGYRDGYDMYQVLSLVQPLQQCSRVLVAVP
jgi:hypothetical protein